jgi:DNA polymerase-4
MPVRTEAAILHVDLDAFFAAVEQLDDPSLRGKPVVVGGLGNRGVVSTASYEARKFGVHSAMPMSAARRACPHAVYLSPRMSRYQDLSRAVMAILRDVTPLVEQLSVDEAFLDVSGARRRLGTPPQIGAHIRSRIHGETGLTASIGVATTKFLAKLTSDMAKPDGMLVIEPGTERAFLAPLPLTRLWGVGPATLTKLERMGLRTIGDVAATPAELLERALGTALGTHLHALATNDDERDVTPDRDAKSIGAEETFGTDLRTREACDRELVRLCDRVGSRLRSVEITARTITLKIRFANFETRTRARTLAEPTDISAVVLDTARELLDEFDVRRGIRLLGVSCSQLGEPGEPAETQMLLDLVDEDTLDHERIARRAAVERAVDDVRDRFGTAAVQPATLLGPGEGER